MRLSLILASSFLALFTSCAGPSATRGSQRCPAWNLSCRVPSPTPRRVESQGPVVLWVGEGAHGALAAGLRAGGVRIEPQRAAVGNDAIWHSLFGLHPRALVLPLGDGPDSLVAAWAAAAAWMPREDAPAVFGWVTDPVDSAARASLFTRLARRDSSDSLFQSLLPRLDSMGGLSQASLAARMELLDSMIHLGTIGRPASPSTWSKAGVMWDSSRYRRLSEAPVERLIPLAGNSSTRVQEVAAWLRDRLPVPAPLDASRPLRIVLDIGHMPRNDSAPIKGQGMISAHGQDEYELNRKAALAMAAALRDSLGAEVIVHNEDGLQRQLRARTLFARRMDADLFLSIHHDAVQLSQTSVWTWQGVERLYCDSISGFSLFVHDSSVNFPQALSLASAIGASLRAGGRTPNLHHARTTERPGREVLDSASGVYRADFAVLLSARMPAILVECGVALNRQEELVLDSDAGRAEFARLVASGVKAWIAAGAPGDPRVTPALSRSTP